MSDNYCESLKCFLFVNIFLKPLLINFKRETDSQKSVEHKSVELVPVGFCEPVFL